MVYSGAATTLSLGVEVVINFWVDKVMTYYELVMDKMYAREVLVMINFMVEAVEILLYLERAKTRCLFYLIM